MILWSSRHTRRLRAAASVALLGYLDPLHMLAVWPGCIAVLPIAAGVALRPTA